MKFLNLKLILIGLLSGISACLQAQLAIGDTSGVTPPHPSAMLDIQGTSRGTLISRMTTAQRKAIVNPAQGLLIYDLEKSHFYFYSGTRWRQLADMDEGLSAIVGVEVSDSAAGDNIGASVAMQGQYSIVGAIGDDVNGKVDQGSAYLFKLEGGNWIQKSKFYAPDGLAGDKFGGDIVMTDSFVLIGACGDDIGANVDQGSVYVYKWQNGSLNFFQKLTASGGASGDEFGQYLSIDGNTAAISAVRDDVLSNADQGSAYIFKLDNNGMWAEIQQIFAPDGAAGDRFGIGIGIKDSTIVAGAYFDDIGSSADQGSAYIFNLNLNGIWNFSQKLVANDGTANDQFGVRVSITADRLVVGAHFDEIAPNKDRGSAYVFRKVNNSWIQEQKLMPVDSLSGDNFGDYFGISVMIRGGKLMVGAHYEDTYLGVDRGAVFTYELENGVWVQKSKITAPDGAQEDYFGYNLAFSGRYLVIGAYGKNSQRGKVYFKEIE